MPAAVLVHYRLMARYNQCLNERLYNACEKLTDADREITPALHPDRANLKHSRESLDAAIEASVPDMPPIFLLGLMRYTNTRGVAREHPAWQALSHFSITRPTIADRSRRCSRRPVWTSASPI